jgi:hypothetical protein
VLLAGSITVAAPLLGAPPFRQPWQVVNLIGLADTVVRLDGSIDEVVHLVGDCRNVVNITGLATSVTGLAGTAEVQSAP